MSRNVLNLSLSISDSNSTSNFLKKKSSIARAILQKFNKSKIAIIKIDNFDDNNIDDFEKENNKIDKNNKDNKNVDDDQKNNNSNK